MGESSQHSSSTAVDPKVSLLAVKLSGGPAVQPDSLLFSDVYHLLHFQQRSPLKPTYSPPLPHSAKCKALSCQHGSLFGHFLHIWIIQL